MKTVTISVVWHRSQINCVTDPDALVVGITIFISMENCKKSDLIVNVRSSRRPRFKAGSELSSKVNMVEVDFNEEVNDTSEMLEVKIKLSAESCESAPSCEA